MNKSFLILSLLSLGNIMAYEALITLNDTVKRGGKTPQQVIDTYKQDKAVVFFNKPGCPFCDTLRPRFQALAQKNKDRAQFIMLNVNGNNSYKSIYGFSTYPTVAYFKNNTKIKQHGSDNGAKTEPHMQSDFNSCF